jgi:hypothetical protein
LNEALHPDRFHPGNSHTAEAGTEHRSKLGDHEAPCCLHFNELFLLPKTPFLDRLACQ